MTRQEREPSTVSKEMHENAGGFPSDSPAGLLGGWAVGWLLAPLGAKSPPKDVYDSEKVVGRETFDSYGDQSRFLAWIGPHFDIPLNVLKRRGSRTAGGWV